MPNALAGWQEALLERHQLDPVYLDYAQQWFAPLGRRLMMHQSGANRSLVVGINGCQGSGKSTACDYLRTHLMAEHGRRVVTLSLDDFYLTRHERQALGRWVHPLLATRGVPGTHDLDLLRVTLDALTDRSDSRPVAIPRFDKAVDDRLPEDDWERVSAGVDMVLLEGWCLGALPQTAQELAEPVNALERAEDPDGRWRTYSNRVLERDFLSLYPRIDHWVMLLAPSFDCVYRWRLEQEQKLAARADAGGAERIMNETEVARFIQYFERLTRQCLEQLPARVDDLFRLDAGRRVVAVECRQERWQ